MTPNPGTRNAAALGSLEQQQDAQQAQHAEAGASASPSTPILPLDGQEAERIARDSHRVADKQKKSPTLNFRTDRYRLARPLLRI
jgi:hypothetical protein